MSPNTTYRRVVYAIFAKSKKITGTDYSKTHSSEQVAACWDQVATFIQEEVGRYRGRDKAAQPPALEECHRGVSAVTVRDQTSAHYGTRRPDARQEPRSLRSLSSKSSSAAPVNGPPPPPAAGMAVPAASCCVPALAPATFATDAAPKVSAILSPCSSATIY
jgi:hypothetical protein